MGEARNPSRPALSAARPDRDVQGRGNSGEGRFHRAALHQRRSGAGEALAGRRRRHGDAARLAHRFESRHPDARPDRIIIEQATVPVVVDAGIGAPSHAAEAMEMGADAVLVNTAIAVAAIRIAWRSPFSCRRGRARSA